MRAHDDVMKAKPVDEEQKQKLVDEIKSRGNAAFKAKRYDEAETLYSKAIEHHPNAHTIFGNRSMARCNMGKFDDAIDDAEKAIKIDPTWSKGYMRQGQAQEKLGLLKSALKSFEKSAELDPENKALAKTITRLTPLAQACDEDVNAPRKRNVKAPSSSSSSSSSSSKKVKEEKVVEKSKSKNDVIRGYKTTSDGRKTSYFNHEQTEEEKNLIGSIAPKRIEKTEAVKIESANASSSAGSAWNSGGTFEESDRTQWAKDCLKNKIMAATCSSNGHTIKVQTVDDLEGDAQIIAARGKRKYVFNFSFKVSVQVDAPGGETFHGEMIYPDVASDEDPSEYEMELKMDAPANVRSMCKSGQGAMCEALAKSMSDFIAQYQKL